MDGFRPVDGASRLDASLEVNRTYLAAMFRHMQVTISQLCCFAQNGVIRRSCTSIFVFETIGLSEGLQYVDFNIHCIHAKCFSYIFLLNSR